LVENHVAIGVDTDDGFPGGLRLGPAHIGIRMQQLTLKIRGIHGVEIHHAEPADAGGGQVHTDGRAQAARADA
jgi:hypothetical protein